MHKQLERKTANKRPNTNMATNIRMEKSSIVRWIVHESKKKNENRSHRIARKISFLRKLPSHRSTPSALMSKIDCSLYSTLVHRNTSHHQHTIVHR